MFASESGGMGYGSVTAAPRADDTWLPPLMIPASKLYNLSSDTKEDQLQLANDILRSSLCLIGPVKHPLLSVMAVAGGVEECGFTMTDDATSRRHRRIQKFLNIPDH